MDGFCFICEPKSLRGYEGIMTSGSTCLHIVNSVEITVTGGRYLVESLSSLECDIN